MSKLKLILLSFIAVIVLLIVFCLVTLPGVFVYIPGGENFYPVDPQAKYHIGQVISGDEASRLINISLNNSIVRDCLGSVFSGTGFRINYTITGVVADRYLEKTPFESYDLLHPHYYKVLPAVEFVCGGIWWDEGVNMYAFVDPDTGLVAYIGYAVRSGIDDGNFSYEPDPEGALIYRTSYNDHRLLSHLKNATVIYTGYDPSWAMSSEQEEELIGIAMNDSRVSDLLQDRSYVTFVSASSFSDYFFSTEYQYVRYYPAVTFATNDTGNSSFILSVGLDPLNKTVTSLIT